MFSPGKPYVDVNVILFYFYQIICVSLMMPNNKEDDYNASCN